MDRIVLIDGSSLIYRAFYAIPNSFTTSGGQPTNAIYGFAIMFRKIFAGKFPAYGAMVFDAPGGTFRDETYPEYKAQRPRMEDELRSQLPFIDRVVEAHDCPVLRVPGFEADDVIGTLTVQAVAAGLDVHIISSDKDFAQLIGPNVRMIDTMRDITYDEELVKKKWGVPPSQFIDYLALLGDKSDNIPGVPGIGQKGAGLLLEKFVSLDVILESTDQLKGRQQKNLIEFREQALLSQDLATIRCNVELELGIEDLALQPPDRERVNTLYKELEFNSLIDEKKAHSAVEDKDNFSIVDTADAFKSAIAAFDAERDVTVFALYEPFDHAWGALVGLSFSTDKKAFYVPTCDYAGRHLATYDVVAEYLADPKKRKVVHNHRDTTVGLARAGMTLSGVVFDTQTASFFVNPTKIIPHNVSDLVKEFLQRNVTPLKTIVGAGKSQKSLFDVPENELGPWACHMAIAIAQLQKPVFDELESEGHVERWRTLAEPMAAVLSRMQLEGIRVDTADLAAMEIEFEARKAAVEQEVYAQAGHEFNIGSVKQLATVLFEELKLPIIKRTKTGYSTAAAVLERLAPDYHIARNVLRWRSLAKLINTYTRVLREAVNPKTGRIHATFQQTSGSSGRLITTNPDLQRTPIRGEDGARIRNAFIPRDGWILISADWSQIELRVLAHISQDKALLDAFTNDRDLHAQTASRIFEVAIDSVTAEQRNMGKTVNFATVYGQGATALGQQLGIPRKEAKAMIERYFDAYSGVRSWLDDTAEKAHVDGYVETILGRRRYIPELKSNNFSDRSYGERIATNTPIQGSAADLCKLAMINIDKTFREEKLDARMLIQIHDELIFETPPGEFERVKTIVRDAMENAYPMSVPLKVDIGSGPNWAVAHS